MKDCNCGYCMGGDILAGFGIKICDLAVSQLILFKEQSHPGRVIVAYKDHVSELVDISAEERALFFEDVAKAANAIHKAFHPNKVNYGAYGDGGCHLHFHLVRWEALFCCFCATVFPKLPFADCCRDATIYCRFCHWMVAD